MIGEKINKFSVVRVCDKTQKKTFSKIQITKYNKKVDFFRSFFLLFKKICLFRAKIFSSFVLLSITRQKFVCTLIHFQYTRALQKTIFRKKMFIKVFDSKSYFIKYLFKSKSHFSEVLIHNQNFFKI